MPAPALQHVGQNGGHAVDDADDVYRDNVRRLDRAQVLPRGRRTHPRVRDKNVNPSPTLAHLRRNAVHLRGVARSEEHTSELQSHSDLVCRLLLEKKKKNKTQQNLSKLI